MKNFLSLKDLTAGEINALVKLAYSIKKRPGDYKGRLKGKSVGLLFQKPSLRTKTAFCLGGQQLGADVIYYSPDEVKLGQREKISDVAKTLSAYMNIVVLRTFSHQIIEEFAGSFKGAVVNGLSDLLHPSQIVGDLLTLFELNKNIKKIKCVYLGDGNNVCHSLLYAFSILGGNVFIATPLGFEPDREVVRTCYSIAKKSKARICIGNNPLEAVSGADVIYTDVWISMGKEDETKMRKKVFKRFMVNDKILTFAKNNYIVMHCLPAHRGEEISDSVLDSANSKVFIQAANRLHSAKAILLYTQGERLCRK
ncbi:MAG: ornithine carbamoyltransferase [Candidatus Omnitrophota bacterium]